MAYEVTVGTETVEIYKANEVKKAEGEVYSVTEWKENALEQRAELAPEQLRELLTILGQKKAESGGPVRINCSGGVHRSVVAAVLYLWSRSDKTLGTVYESVFLAGLEAGRKPSGMVTNTLGYAIARLLQKAIGANPVNWTATKDLVYAGAAQQALYGAK